MTLRRCLGTVSTMIAASTLLSFAGQTSSMSGTESTGYHMKVVSRSTQSVDYRHKGSTKVDFKGTNLMPGIDGEAKVEGRPGGVKLEVSLDHMQPANSLGLAYLTYVLWAITPEGQSHNLGEMVVKDGESSLHTTTDLQAFALVLTAEPDFGVAEPSELVVAQNIVRPDTKGGVEPVDVTYELISRDVYNSQVQSIPQPMYGVDKSIPLDLLEARNAVRIAKDAGADQFASANLQKAQDSLNRAEDYYQRKQGSGPIGTVAREAVQAAEAARVMSMKNQQQQEADHERQAAADREAQARADADKQQQAATQAQAQASQAQADAQAAQQAKAEADQARQQAETDKQQMRAHLLQQLNQVLETKDTARGLIVNMPDVLFDTGKAELKSTARERLAKVAGILVAYPDMKVEIDGYTDSTGSLPFNEQLSKQRAESVRSYLASQGVKDSSLTTQGFGPDNPIASNETLAGRQQNRRVELIVNGSSISDLVAPVPGSAVEAK